MIAQNQDVREVPRADSDSTPSGRSFDALRTLIERCAELLPAQGPITAFVHHNTLHHMEELPFHVAVEWGATLFGCEPYLAESTYRQMLETGRIRRHDLNSVLLEDLGDGADTLIGRLGTRYHLRMAMLQNTLRMATHPELKWVMSETEALQKFRPETPMYVRNRMIVETRHWVMRDLRNGGDPDANPALLSQVQSVCEQVGRESLESWNDDKWEEFTLRLLWSVCLAGTTQVGDERPDSLPRMRHRDWLLDATGEDSDLLVNNFLIRQCAAFLDQGLARWTMPQREHGFYRAVLSLYAQEGVLPDRWLRHWPAEARRLLEGNVTPLASIEESLRELGVADDQREAFLIPTLLSLRGWAGILWQLETRGDRVAYPAPPGSLIEFVAVRLLLDRLAIAHIARDQLGYVGPLSELRRALTPQPKNSTADKAQQHAFAIFQLAQVRGWYPRDLYCQSRGEWMRLVREVEDFSSTARRRVYHIAYEERYLRNLLDAVSLHAARATPLDETPRFQLSCCLDDREESFRRHLEEVAPDCETFGVAGFYGVAMYYRGVADAYYLPLCPVIIKPQHFVREEAAYTFESAHRRRAGTRRALGTASHRWHVGSRTFLGGLLTALVGAVASVPLVMRTLFPRMTARICRAFGSLVGPPLVTQLQLERTEPTPGVEPGHIGYSVDEMAAIVSRVLHEMGLIRRFARLVIIVGHGSSSLNNPHESAYNCGACAGGRGGPNARAFAQMANDARVRDILARQGLVIPQTTWFVGAYHNTCDDRVTYFDLDRLPLTHRGDFQRAKQDIDEARRRNAHERCRRFESASLSLTSDEALRHVEGRAEDLSQARPEFNHATNAVTIVGRRWRTRGLFLDRRAFLTSYDPTIDDADATLLGRILQAAVPVCAGISLEYYFSCVDPDGWGCGSKLPHNVTSLLGVMSGAASDLRPGLSTQMIEIHEPLRQTFIIETTPEMMMRIIDRDPVVKRLCANQWVYLATIDPSSAQIHVFRHGRFEPHACEQTELPVCGSSVAWYRGWRDHLGFAAIVPASESVESAHTEESTCH